MKNKTAVTRMKERFEERIQALEAEVAELKKTGWVDGPVPVGPHKAVIEKVEERVSFKGLPYLRIDFRVHGYKTLVYYNQMPIVHTPILQSLHQLGLEGRITWLTDHQVLVGKHCFIDVSHETYNGKLIARIDKLEAV